MMPSHSINELNQLVWAWTPGISMIFNSPCEFQCTTKTANHFSKPHDRTCVFTLILKYGLDILKPEERKSFQKIIVKKHKNKDKLKILNPTSI